MAASHATSESDGEGPGDHRGDDVSAKAPTRPLHNGQGDVREAQEHGQPVSATPAGSRDLTVGPSRRGQWVQLAGPHGARV